jgi:hypothetical protein
MRMNDHANKPTQLIHLRSDCKFKHRIWNLRGQHCAFQHRRLTLHSKVSWYTSDATQGRGPLREQILLKLRVVAKSGKGASRKGEETERRYPGDDVDSFSCFISVPSGKYRTAVLLKLGHDHFFADPSHFITSYPMACSLNRTCTHPGWRVAVTTRFCNVATNINAASVWNLPHVNLRTPRICWRLPDIWENVRTP